MVSMSLIYTWLPKWQMRNTDTHDNSGNTNNKEKRYTTANTVNTSQTTNTTANTTSSSNSVIGTIGLATFDATTTATTTRGRCCHRCRCRYRPLSCPCPMFLCHAFFNRMKQTPARRFSHVANPTATPLFVFNDLKTYKFRSCLGKRAGFGM